MLVLSYRPRGPASHRLRNRGALSSARQVPVSRLQIGAIAEHELEEPEDFDHVLAGKADTVGRRSLDARQIGQQLGRTVVLERDIEPDRRRQHMRLESIETRIPPSTPTTD